jgi:serine/threonine-protein kinase
VPDPVVTTSDTELRTHVERALSAAYELDREIGRGGMGIVYRARDRRLKRNVAIKILPPELAFRSEIRTRFLREAETAAQLSHPHIVPIYSVDEVDGLVYFAMACVDGDNLGKRLHDRGLLPPDEVRKVLSEVADALAYAHARGVVHRDIKPDNILFDRDDDRAMVTDFGIARAIIEGSDARLTATGIAIGTPAYMSPEQSAGDREIDGRADLYALGVVGYQMVAGQLPFEASSTAAMLVKHLSERPVPLEQRRPDVPPDLAAIIMRLLEKDPSDRYSSAVELEAVLQGAHGSVPAGSYATTRPAAAQGAAGVRPFAGAGGATRAPVSYGDTGDVDAFVPTGEDLARWDAPGVQQFRGQVGKFVIVNSAVLILALLTSVDLVGLTALWTVFLAFKYAKLWSDGYDWRDVFKQPRERLFMDVVAEQADHVAAVFDPEKRARLRERARRRRLRQQGAGGDGYGRPMAALPSASPRDAVAATGPHAQVVRQAQADRDEIARLLQSMPRADRDRIADVLPSAEALSAKIRELAATLTELDRTAAPGTGEQLEREISRLEAEANPLDRSASEERVRRLAYLKRERRAVVDAVRRRGAAASRLESCRLALQNMRLDLVRLRTGGGTSVGQVTPIGERAMALAREVDGMVYAADQLSTPPGRSRASAAGNG